MKEWVKVLLEEHDRRDLLTNFDKYKGRNLRYAEEDRPSVRQIFFEIAQELIKDLGNCDFGLKADDPEINAFTRMFGSVLGTLPQTVFYELCHRGNVFYTYESPAPAYVKTFDLCGYLARGERALVVTFTRELGSDIPWDVGRGIIIHELVHVLLGLGLPCKSKAVDEVPEENVVHAIARALGFEHETNEANKWEKNRKGVI